jgi:hypothetical protein
MERRNRLEASLCEAGCRTPAEAVGPPSRRAGHRTGGPTTLDREELLGLMQDSLESLALELGLLVASAILEDEVTRLCGARYQRQTDRAHTRYGPRGRRDARREEVADRSASGPSGQGRR